MEGLFPGDWSGPAEPGGKAQARFAEANRAP